MSSKPSVDHAKRVVTHDGHEYRIGEGERDVAVYLRRDGLDVRIGHAWRTGKVVVYALLKRPVHAHASAVLKPVARAWFRADKRVPVATLDPIARTASVDGRTYRYVEYLMFDRADCSVIARHLEMYDGHELLGSCESATKVSGMPGQGRVAAAALHAIATAWYTEPFVLRCNRCRQPAVCLAEGPRELVLACGVCCAHDAGCRSVGPA